MNTVDIKKRLYVTHFQNIFVIIEYTCEIVSHNIKKNVHLYGNVLIENDYTASLR